MNEYFQLEPEVSGELGGKTIMDNSTHPPKIEKLEFLFKGWLGDCLIECFPVFLITEKVAQKLTGFKITGFSLKEAEIRKDYPFDELQPNLTLPNFTWIEINGIAKQSDFGIENNLLVVSGKVLEILKSEGLNHCDIEKK
nr:hypothetical protein [uncultured Carboxylicivirga sp.]